MKHRVYDALTYPGKPVIDNFLPLNMVYDRYFWPNYETVPIFMPDNAVIDAIDDTYPICLDIEAFPLYDDWLPELITPPNAEVFGICSAIIARIRQRTAQRIGWFGILGKSGFLNQPCGKVNKQKYIAKATKLKSFIDSVDFIAFGAYLDRTDNNENTWENLLSAMLREGRRVTDKQIIAFMGSTYIEGDWENLPADVFAHQFDTLRAVCDIAIWNNWHNTTPWNEADPFVPILRSRL